MSKQAPYWSSEQVEELRKLAGTMSCSQIGKLIGRSKDAVKNKMGSLGLKAFNPALKSSSHPAPIAIRDREKKVAPTAIKSPKAKARVTPYSARASERLEWCPSCHAPVSNWPDHSSRVGCKRPA